MIGGNSFGQGKINHIATITKVKNKDISTTNAQSIQKQFKWLKLQIIKEKRKTVNGVDIS